MTIARCAKCGTRGRRSGRFFSALTWINARALRVERRGRVFPIATKEQRAATRKRQTDEFESNQKDLRHSIAESERLVGEADAMIRRHRDECDAEGK